MELDLRKIHVCILVKNGCYYCDRFRKCSPEVIDERARGIRYPQNLNCSVAVGLIIPLILLDFPSVAALKLVQTIAAFTGDLWVRVRIHSHYASISCNQCRRIKPRHLAHAAQ